MWEGARIMTYVLSVEGCKNKKIFLSTGVCKNKDYYFEVWENCKNKEFQVLLKVATKINILKIFLSRQQILLIYSNLSKPNKKETTIYMKI